MCKQSIFRPPKVRTLFMSESTHSKKVLSFKILLQNCKVVFSTQVEDRAISMVDWFPYFEASLVVRKEKHQTARLNSKPAVPIVLLLNIWLICSYLQRSVVLHIHLSLWMYKLNEYRSRRWVWHTISSLRSNKRHFFSGKRTMSILKNRK